MNSRRTRKGSTVAVVFAAALAALLTLSGCGDGSTGRHKSGKGPVFSTSTAVSDGGSIPVVPYGGSGGDTGGGDTGGGDTGGGGGGGTSGAVLSGYVVDVEGQPVSMANIEIRFVNSGDAYVTSDGSGAYAFDASNSGGLTVGTVVCEPYDPNVEFECTPIDVTAPVTFDPNDGPRVINWVVRKI